MTRITTIAALCALALCGAAACGDSDPADPADNNTSANNTSSNNTSSNNTSGGTNNTSANNTTNNTSSNNTNTTSNNTTDTTPMTPAEMALEQLGDELATFACTVAFDCPEAAPEFLAAGLGRYASKQECIDDDAGQFGSGMSGEAASVESGRLTFDEMAFMTCIAEIRMELDGKACTADIDAFENLGEEGACANVFQGAVTLGGNCLSTDECVGDLECNPDPNGAVCYGTCVDDSDPVDACMNLCMPGQYCQADPMTGLGTCLDFAGDGEACSPRGFGGEDPECAEGFACLLNEMFEGTCAPAGSVMMGGRCGFTPELCAEGLDCDLQTQTCQPAEPEPEFTVSKNGESCDFGGACEAGTSCQDLDFMSGSGTCKPISTSGGSCLLPNDCAAGLACIVADFMQLDGTCGPPVADGEMCLSGDQCISGACSNGNNPFMPGTCVATTVCEVP